MLRHCLFLLQPGSVVSSVVLVDGQEGKHKMKKDEDSQEQATTEEELPPAFESADDQARALAQYVNLTSLLEAETVLEVSLPRLAERGLSSWDLMLHRAARLTADEEAGMSALDALLADVSSVLAELRALLEGCLRPEPRMKRKRGRRPKRQILAEKKAKAGKNCFDLDDSLALAMGLEGGRWRMRDRWEVNYSHPMVKAEELFLPGAAEDNDEEIFEEEEKPVLLKEKPAKRAKKNEVLEEVKEEEEQDTVKQEDDVEEGKRPQRRRRKPKRLEEDGLEEGAVKEEGQVKAEDGVVARGKTSRRVRTEEEEARGDTYLCLKCGQRLCRAYGKQHEAKCDGFFVRHPEYRQVYN